MVLVGQDLFADAHALGRDLEQLVVRNEFQRRFDRHLARRDQAQRVVRAGGAHVGELLFLAHVDRHIVSARVLSNDHALVHLCAWADEQRAALLCIEQSVAYGFAGFEGDQRTGGALGDLALVRLIAVENRGQDAFALGIG